MAQDDVSVDGAGGRPTLGEPGVEQVISAGATVPHGDRIDSAESGGVEDEVAAVLPGQHHVVGELVLHHHLRHVARRRAGEAPAHHVLEQGEGPQLPLQGLSLLGRQGGSASVDQRHHAPQSSRSGGRTVDREAPRQPSGAFSGSSAVKVAPPPSVGVRWMPPSWPSAMWSAIHRPSPKPPWLRAETARSKRPKMRSPSSEATPGPWSTTLMRTLSAEVATLTSMGLPAPNLRALSTRLSTSWRSRSGSN